MGRRRAALTPNIDRLAARGVQLHQRAHGRGLLRPLARGDFHRPVCLHHRLLRTATLLLNHPEIRPLQVSLQKGGYETFGARQAVPSPGGQHRSSAAGRSSSCASQAQRERAWPSTSGARRCHFPIPSRTASTTDRARARSWAGCSSSGARSRTTRRSNSWTPSGRTGRCRS